MRPRFVTIVMAIALTLMPIGAVAQEQPDPATQAAERAAAEAQAAAASLPRFDPSLGRCVNEPSSAERPRWTTIAPREPARPASVVTLGVSGGAWNEMVTLTVTAPDGDQLAVSEPLTQRGSIGLAYPIRPALPGPESRVPGTYSAVWTDAWGTFIACDGFVVER